jgi:YesN/AraC family two-component response regulator
MPKMNGFELYDKMKRIDNKVKVCFISAYDVDYNALREQISNIRTRLYASKDCYSKAHSNS